MTDWQDRAACRNAKVDMYPEDQPGRRPGRAIAEAKAVCRWCPVRDECLAYALSTETRWTRFGIWGGLTPAERDEFATGRAS